MRDHAVLWVNGRRYTVRGVAAMQTVSDWLRYDLRLTGTKVVCAEGDCGACTVLVGRFGGAAASRWRFDAINCCITAVAQLDGCHLITIEGVADETGLHEVQRAMVEHHGSQCGFCTPGFVMAMLGQFEAKPGPATEKQIKNRLTGNLCRCTGYQPILDAGVTVRPEHTRSVVARHHSQAIAADLSAARKQPLRIEQDGSVYEAPGSLSALLEARAGASKARLISGNTDLGVLVNKGKLWPAGEPRHAISLHLVDELAGVRVDNGRMLIGARATLDEVERASEQHVPELAQLLHVFASPQIKAAATLVGNVANGSPIGDTLPALFALGAELHLESVRGARRVPIDQYYKGYKVFDLAPDELITAVSFEIPPLDRLFKAYKVCQRKDLDISYVGAAFAFDLEAGVVTAARVAYGGVAATVLRLHDVEQSLLGVALDDADAWERTAVAIERAVTPRSDVRGSAEGRRILCGNLFRRLGADLRGEVSQ